MAAPDDTTPLLGLAAVALDTETTSLDAQLARLVQIGVVPIDPAANDAAAPYGVTLNPGVPIPPVTTAVHGISDADVVGSPTFAAVIDAFEAAIGPRVVVGHTLGYDLAVLGRAYAAAGRSMPGWRTLDVRTLARIAAPGLADYSLERLCEWLGVQIEGRHTALGDAVATAAVFRGLLPHLRSRGVRTLGEAEAAVRRLADLDVDVAYRMPGRMSPPAETPMRRIDGFAYRTRVTEVMSSPPLTVSPQTTVADVLRQLMERGASSVFTQRNDSSLGIVTERDLLRAIDTDGAAALNRAIGEIAKGPLECVAGDDFVYRAIGRITRLRFRHLGVTGPDGSLIGAVTTRDLLRHRSTTAIVMGDAIDQARDAAALGAAFAELPALARGLRADGVPPRQIAAVISAEICATTARAAVLAEAQMRASGRGEPPQPYAVLVLGSGGRGESQLAADQDNAIVYAEGAEGSDADRWFEALATHMNVILDAAGVPLCKGGVMARNRAWRKSLADWRATIDGWVRRQRPEDLLAVDIFFDAVAVHGERAFVEQLWQHAYDRGHGARDFQNVLIESARSPAPAFTMFGGFRVDTGGRIDLKKTGLLPLFTAARVLSIRHDVRARSSAERMRGAGAAAGASPDQVERIINAQETLLGAVIDQQLVDGTAGLPPTPRVVPARLPRAEQDRLRDALKAVASAVDLAAEGRV